MTDSWRSYSRLTTTLLSWVTKSIFKNRQYSNSETKVLRIEKVTVKRMKIWSRLLRSPSSLKPNLKTTKKQI